MATELISILDLHKRFGDNHVLKGINLNIHQGEVVVVIGPSGSGKSTLLRSMILLEVPTKGKILFENIDITDKKMTYLKCVKKWEWFFSNLIFFQI